MAAFKRRVQGHRGEANRLGSRDSGITSDVKSRETEVCVQAGAAGLDESVQVEPTRWAGNVVYVGGPTFDAAFADGREVSA